MIENLNNFPALPPPTNLMIQEVNEKAAEAHWDEVKGQITLSDFTTNFLSILTTYFYIEIFYLY